MRNLLITVLMVLILGALFYNNVLAACTGASPNLIAASASRSDVGDCVTTATDGDIIFIPAGNALWTSGLPMTKFIRLVGAGVGRTIITSDWLPVEKITDTAYILSWNPSTPSLNLPLGVSGITFNLAGKTCGFKVTNSGSTPITKLRVNNNLFSNTLNFGGQRTFFINGNIYGVIDSNTLDSGGAIYGQNGNWGIMSFSYGSANQLYIEDNTFTTSADGNTGGGVGGRYCARYNTYTRSSASSQFQPFEYHGNQPSANSAGMGMEIYGNMITNTSGSLLNLAAVVQRGGMAVVHHNAAYGGTGGFTSNASFLVYEEYVDNDGTPSPVGPTGQPQHVSSSYYWLNQKSGGFKNVVTGITKTYPLSGTGLLANDYGRTLPQENVDFWNYNSIFNGTSGIGCGTRVNRPTTCTTGVAYWETDQSCSDISRHVGAGDSKTPISGTLYICTSTNTWMAHYTPYTYPHPLRIGQPGNLDAPQGLKILSN